MSTSVLGWLRLDPALRCRLRHSVVLGVVVLAGSVRSLDAICGLRARARLARLAPGSAAVGASARCSTSRARSCADLARRGLRRAGWAPGSGAAAGSALPCLRGSGSMSKREPPGASGDGLGVGRRGFRGSSLARPRASTSEGRQLGRRRRGSRRWSARLPRRQLRVASSPPTSNSDPPDAAGSAGGPGSGLVAAHVEQGGAATGLGRRAGVRGLGDGALGLGGVALGLGLARE